MILLFLQSADPTTTAAFDNLGRMNDAMPAYIAAHTVAQLKVDCAILAGFLMIISIVRMIIWWNQKGWPKRAPRGR